MTRQEVQEYYEEKIEKYVGDNDYLANQLHEKMWQMYDLLSDIDYAIDKEIEEKESKKTIPDWVLADEFNYSCRL